MVGIKEIRISNSGLTAKPPGMIALFIGATSGIGMGTLKQFAKCANAPKVYIVGRSKSAATPLVDELKNLNPQERGRFLRGNQEGGKTHGPYISVSGLSDLRRKARHYPRYHADNIALETTEGIDILSSLSYYSRLRIIHNLHPLLIASTNPRIVSVLAGGRERGFDIDDLELQKNYSFKTVVNTATTQTTLAFEELAKSSPMISFCHVYPGFVNTGQLDKLMQTAKGIWTLPATLARWTLIPMLNIFARTVDEAGEWGLFVATSAKYPPTEPKDPGEVGVVLPNGVETAKSSVVKDGKGNGVYRLDNYGESVENECDSILADYRLNEAGKEVLEKTLMVWERIR